LRHLAEGLLYSVWRSVLQLLLERLVLADLLFQLLDNDNLVLGESRIEARV